MRNTKTDQYGRVPLNCAFNKESFLILKQYCDTNNQSIRKFIRDMADEKAEIISKAANKSLFI